MEGIMDLQQISDLAQTGAIGVLVILLGMIKIPKVELNVWNLIGRTMGRSIKNEMM